MHCCMRNFTAGNLRAKVSSSYIMICKLIYHTFSRLIWINRICQPESSSDAAWFCACCELTPSVIARISWWSTQSNPRRQKLMKVDPIQSTSTQAHDDWHNPIYVKANSWRLTQSNLRRRKLMLVDTIQSTSTQTHNGRHNPIYVNAIQSISKQTHKGW